jgi:hypothetical protein
MTIVPFPRDSVFGPQDIEAMSTALEDVCTILNLADEAKSEKEFLAKKLVALAHQVPRDAALLRDRMLREIASGRREWPAALVRAARCGALWGANKHAAHCSRASPRTFA